LLTRESKNHAPLRVDKIVVLLIFNVSQIFKECPIVIERILNLEIDSKSDFIW